MPLPFFSHGFRKQPQTVLAVDLGRHTTKAVLVAREHDSLVLRGCALQPTQAEDKPLSANGLATLLKALSQSLEPKSKTVALALGTQEAVIRTVEVPPMPLPDLRAVLRRGSRTYLQQDLADHVFDGQVLNSYVEAESLQAGSPARNGVRKQRVLVAGAREKLVGELAQGVRQAGLQPEHIMPGLLGAVNALQQAMPELVQGAVTALVDLGFKSSSVCVLNDGEVALSRVIPIGGDRLTAVLGEALNISYAEAEGIKVGGLLEGQAAVEPLLTALGRELRASLDFFEHQSDKRVSRVFLAGAGAASELILQHLQGELAVPCQSWNPTAWLKLELPPQQAEEVQQIATQLAVALGTAQAVL